MPRSYRRSATTSPRAGFAGRTASPAGSTIRLWARFAQEDFEDVAAADTVVCFLEPGGGGSGGRHVEFGMALAWGKRTIVVGEPEHLFHTLPSVEAYPTWPQALDALR